MGRTMRVSQVPKFGGEFGRIHNVPDHLGPKPLEGLLSPPAIDPAQGQCISLCNPYSNYAGDIA